MQQRFQSWISSIFNVFSSEYKNSFASLTGVAALAYFVQNTLLTITRAQKNRDHIVSTYGWKNLPAKLYKCTEIQPKHFVQQEVCSGKD